MNVFKHILFFVIVGFASVLQPTFGKTNLDSLYQLLETSNQQDSSKAVVLCQLSWNLKFDSALLAEQYAEEALKISKDLNLPKIEGKSYNYLGVIHSIHGDYIGAINYYIKALEIFEELNNTDALASINNNIGMLYFYENSYSNAVKHYLGAYKIHKTLNKPLATQRVCINLGDAYRMLEQLDSGLFYLEEGLKLNEQYGDNEMLAPLLVNKALIIEQQGKEALAVQLFKQAYEIDKSLGDKEGMSIDLINLGIAEQKMKNYDKAKEYLSLSESYAQEIDFKDHLAEVYQAFVDLYKEQNMYKEALEYEEKYMAVHDSLLDANMRDAVAQIEERHRHAKLEAENETLRKSNELKSLKVEQHELEIRQTQTLIGFLLAGFVVLLILAYVLYKSNLHRKQSNQVLAEQNHQIESQNTLIEEKNKDITDSIEYARKIQFSILPDHKLFHKYFSEHFIMYKPKDIVSGDFYWAQERNGKFYFAVVDCTGHGVPGALMSIIAYDGLNTILGDNANLRPGQILDRLHFLVRDMQHLEEGSSIKEGMDLGLCCYDPEKKILEFAGALNPLLIFMDDEFIELDGDKRSIASSLQHQKSYYRNYLLKVDTGVCFYLLTDGFQDQFGGPKGKKITKKRLIKKLTEIHKMEMNKQGMELDKFLKTWKKQEKQIDDICVIGIKV